jgi:hypothetical protein
MSLFMALGGKSWQRNNFGSFLGVKRHFERVDVMPALCKGFSDAEMLGSPNAGTVGVGEAPRHEVAGGGAPTVQRTLWGLRPDAVVEG